MIRQSPYFPKQMNGPVVNAVLAAMDERLKDADIIETFKTIGTSRQEFIKKCIREVTNAKN